MKKWNLVLTAVVTAIIMVAGVAAFQPTASDASAVNKKKGPEEATLEFSIELRKGTSVAQIVDAVKKGAGIGAPSGSFAVDSFFDITYEFTLSPSRIEIVSMSLRAAPNDPNLNPGAVIDSVRAAVGDSGDVYIGHVTVLK